MIAQDVELQHAIELTQGGKFHEAELAWRKLELQFIRRYAAVHAALGLVLAQQGELEQAAVEYRKALALDPHQADASMNLGLAEFKQGKFAAAIDPLLAARKEKPDDPRTGILLGMSYYGAREYAKAVPYLQAAVNAAILRT